MLLLTLPTRPERQRLNLKARIITLRVSESAAAMKMGFVFCSPRSDNIVMLKMIRLFWSALGLHSLTNNTASAKRRLSTGKSRPTVVCSLSPAMCGLFRKKRRIDRTPKPPPTDSRYGLPPKVSTDRVHHRDQYPGAPYVYLPPAPSVLDHRHACISISLERI